MDSDIEQSRWIKKANYFSAVCQKLHSFIAKGKRLKYKVLAKLLMVDKELLMSVSNTCITRTEWN